MSYIKDGIALGVGTGSTVDIFIELLQPLRREARPVVSSSERSTRRLAEFGINGRVRARRVDDSISTSTAPTKPRNIVHLDQRRRRRADARKDRRSSVASLRLHHRRDEARADARQVSPARRSRFRWRSRTSPDRWSKAGGQPILREGFVTDNGNHIIDVHNLKIANPLELETRFNQIAGVVTVGIFANRPADVLLIGSASGVKTMQ